MSVHVRASARRGARACQRESTREPELQLGACHAEKRHGTRLRQLMKECSSCERRAAAAHCPQREESTRHGQTRTFLDLPTTFDATAVNEG